jgi:hypothetical protein
MNMNIDGNDPRSNRTTYLDFENSNKINTRRLCPEDLGWRRLMDKWPLTVCQTK